MEGCVQNKSTLVQAESRWPVSLVISLPHVYVAIYSLQSPVHLKIAHLALMQEPFGMHFIAANLQMGSQGSRQAGLGPCPFLPCSTSCLFQRGNSVGEGKLGRERS